MLDSKLRDTGARIIIMEHLKHDMAYCTTCYARNYDAHIGHSPVGKRVMHLYDIYFDMIAPSKVTLCGECLTGLYGALDKFIANGFREASVEVDP